MPLQPGRECGAARPLAAAGAGRQPQALSIRSVQAFFFLFLLLLLLLLIVILLLILILIVGIDKAYDKARDKVNSPTLPNSHTHRLSHS